MQPQPSSDGLPKLMKPGPDLRPHPPPPPSPLPQPHHHLHAVSACPASGRLALSAAPDEDLTLTIRLPPLLLGPRKNPAPHIVAAPLPSNLLEWWVHGAVLPACCAAAQPDGRLVMLSPHRHYCIYDLSDCPYAGGFYHGKLVFPEEYPYKVREDCSPSFQMLLGWRRRRRRFARTLCFARLI